MWYTVVSRCAVPHVSPLGPLWRSPQETLLVTISERSRALFNTLIRFTIRDSVCTFVIIATDMCLSTTKQFSLAPTPPFTPNLSVWIFNHTVLTVLSGWSEFFPEVRFQFSHIDIQLFHSPSAIYHRNFARDVFERRGVVVSRWANGAPLCPAPKPKQSLTTGGLGSGSKGDSVKGVYICIPKFQY